MPTGPKPWTVRGVPAEVANAASAAARKQKQKVGPWLTQAIKDAIQAERRGSQVPALVGQGVGRGVRQRVDLSDVTAAIALIAQVAQATGKPPPDAVVGAAYARIKETLTPSRAPRVTRTRDYSLGAPPPPGDDQAAPNQAPPVDGPSPATVPQDMPVVASSPAAEDARPTGEAERPTTGTERPTARAKRPTAEGKRPTKRQRDAMSKMLNDIIEGKDDDE